MRIHQRLFWALATFYIATVSAGIAHGATWLYCPPLGKYWPYTQTCPVLWQKVAPNGKPNGGMMLPPKPGTAPAVTAYPAQALQRPNTDGAAGRSPEVVEAAFQQGLADRASWETWDASLSGDIKEGADWWSANRSVKGHAPCNGQPHTQGWVDGCLAAKVKMDFWDERRKSDPDYRRGWNSYRADQPQAAVVADKPLPAEDDATTRLAAQEAYEQHNRDILADNARKQKDQQAAAEAARLATQRQEEEAQRQRDAADGFKETTISDIRLDYKSMDDDTRVIVTGYYSTLGQVAMLAESPDSTSSIYVMSDNLPREIRRTLLDCEDCRVTVWAHYGCTITLFNQKSGAPCFVADRLKMGG